MRTLTSIFFLFYVAKLLGQPVFQKGYDFPGYGYNYDYSYSVLQTKSGNYVTVGRTGQGRDCDILYTNSTGSVMWSKTIGGTNFEELMSVIETTDKHIVALGYTGSFGAGYDDFYLIKMDSLGNVIWTKTYGGPLDDEGYSLCQSSDGGYVLCGQTASYGASPKDLYIIKTDSAGTVQWTKTFGGTCGGSIYATSDGGFVVAGGTASFGAGGSDVIVLRLNSTGSLVWVKTYGGNTHDMPNCIIQSSDAGFVITGNTLSFGNGIDDIFLLKIDDVGNIQWANTFGGTDGDYGNAVCETSGGYVLTGWISSMGSGGSDVALIKTDYSGNLLWNKLFSGIKSERAYSLFKTIDNGFIISAYTESYGAGFTNTYLIKTDPQGNSASCNIMSASNLQNPASFGSSIPSIVMGTSLPTSNIASSNISNIVPIINDVCGSISGLNEVKKNENDLLTIFPNPTTNALELCFKCDQPDNNIQVNVYNTLGQQIYSEAPLAFSNEYRKKIDLSKQAKGFYFIEVIVNRRKFTKQLILD